MRTMSSSRRVWELLYQAAGTDVVAVVVVVVVVVLLLLLLDVAFGGEVGGADYICP